MDFLLTVVAIIIILALIYWFGVKDYALIADVPVNGPKPWPYLGNIPQVIKYGGLHKAFWECFKRYGRVHKFYLGRRPGFAVTDPEIVRHILAKDFDKFRNRPEFVKVNPPLVHSVVLARDHKWKRIRTILTPTFSTAKLKQLVPIVEGSVVQLENKMERLARSGENVNITELFSLFSLDVIMKSAFGYDTDVQNQPNEEFLQRVKNVLQIPLWKRAFTMFPFSDHLSKILDIQILKGADYFMAIASKIMASRNEQGAGGRRDLLQLMLEAREEELDGLPRLSDDELAAQSLIVLIAGFESTSTSLTSTAYMLATYPDVQEKLLQELDKARANHQGLSVYDLANHVGYLDQVVSEVMRLCTPGFNLLRTCNEDVVINGIRFPKGADINIPNYCLHRDPEAWERPDEFYPEHFTAEAKEKRHPYSYMPFGSGPRQCIGMRFALNEMKIALLTIMEKYKFERCSETKNLDHVSSVVMLPKDNVVLKIVQR